MFCWYQISDSRPSDPIPVHGPVGFILNETRMPSICPDTIESNFSRKKKDPPFPPSHLYSPPSLKKTFLEKKNETNFHSPYRASRTAYRGHSRTHSPPVPCVLPGRFFDQDDRNDEMTKWYIFSWNSSDSNALCFFYKKKKKKTLFTTLCCVVFTVFVALLSRAIKASAEVACADEMMTRCCICTRRRKTKEVEVKLESSTAQQPTAIPAGHVERPPWKEKKKEAGCSFFFFFFFQVRWTDVSGHQL